MKAIYDNISYVFRTVFTRQGLIENCAMFMSLITLKKSGAYAHMQYNEALYDAYVTKLSKLSRLEIIKFYAYVLDKGIDNSAIPAYLADIHVSAMYLSYLFR